MPVSNVEDQMKYMDVIYSACIGGLTEDIRRLDRFLYRKNRKYLETIPGDNNYVISESRSSMKANTYMDTSI